MPPKIIAGHVVYFDNETGVIRLRFQGLVNRDNLVEMAEGIYAEPAYDPASDILFDMASATFDLNFADMLYYANRFGKDPRRVRGATVIVSRSLLHFGFGRMFDNIAGDLLGRARFERSVEAAETWLAELRDKGAQV